MSSSSPAPSSPPSFQQLQEVPFPDRFYLASTFLDQTFGDLEQNQTLSSETKLILYALRKQAEEGPCNDPAPYVWNVTERYKHGAWKGLGQMIKPEAMVHFVRQIEKLDPDWMSKMISKNTDHNPNHNNNKSDALNITPYSSQMLTDDQEIDGTVKQHQTRSGGKPIQVTPPQSPTNNNNNDEDDDDEFEIASSSTSVKSNNKRSKEGKRRSSTGGSRKSSHSNNSPPSSAGAVVDISQLSDSQMMNLVAKSENDEAYVPSSVARGLLNEVLRLRRSLLMSHALPEFTSSTDYQQPQIPSSTSGGNSNHSNYYSRSSPRYEQISVSASTSNFKVSLASKTQRSPPPAHQTTNTNDEKRQNMVVDREDQKNTDERNFASASAAQQQPEQQKEQSKENEAENKKEAGGGWFTWLTG